LFDYIVDRLSWLALLAGIYGMNFMRMPELQWPYGYPVTLGLMAMIAIGTNRKLRLSLNVGENLTAALSETRIDTNKMIKKMNFRTKFVTITATVFIFLATAANCAVDLQFTPVAKLTWVVDIRHAGDGSERLFLVTKVFGRIHILNDGALLETLFLDIGNRISTTPGGERGLLSLAFAPDYKTSGFFYVWYTDKSGDTTLSRFSVSDDPNVANADSEEILLVVTQTSPTILSA